MNFIHDRDVAVEHESIPDLMRDLRDEALILVRQQIELAKSETSEKVSKVVKNSISVVIGGVVLYTGILFLLAGLTFLGYSAMVNAGVSSLTAMWVMPLITGAVIGIIGFIMVQASSKKIKHTSVVPEKTLNTLKEDRKWISKRNEK